MDEEEILLINLIPKRLFKSGDKVTRCYGKTPREVGKIFSYVKYSTEQEYCLVDCGTHVYTIPERFLTKIL